MILANDEVFEDDTFDVVHVLPAANLDFTGGEKIKSYVNSSSRLMATMHFKGIRIGFMNESCVVFFIHRFKLNKSKHTSSLSLLAWRNIFAT